MMAARNFHLSSSLDDPVSSVLLGPNKNSTAMDNNPLCCSAFELDDPSSSCPHVPLLIMAIPSICMSDWVLPPHPLERPTLCHLCRIPPFASLIQKKGWPGLAQTLKNIARSPATSLNHGSCRPYASVVVLPQMAYSHSTWRNSKKRNRILRIRFPRPPFPPPPPPREIATMAATNRHIAAIINIARLIISPNATTILVILVIPFIKTQSLRL